MDSTEKIVSDHLSYRGFANVQYEPDGNIPPDFLVDGNIAIEVRRLNQNYFDGNDVVGLEDIAIPLWIKLKRLVADAGPAFGNHSWIVFFRFTRPVEPWKVIEAKVTKALKDFMVAPIRLKGTIVKIGDFELEVLPASKLHATMFVMGGCSDEESGGWLISEMEINIRYCVNEKSAKIAKVRPKYRQWWLALVDYIGYGLDELERELFFDQVSIAHDWDKIILIDPRNPARWFEI